MSSLEDELSYLTSDREAHRLLEDLSRDTTSGLFVGPCLPKLIDPPRVTNLLSSPSNNNHDSTTALQSRATGNLEQQNVERCLLVSQI